MMNIVDTIANRCNEQAELGLLESSDLSAVQPNTIVLQPNGSLDEVNSAAFQQVLEKALDQVTDAVIVDLLWVDKTDASGIAALAAGVQRAIALGKVLSFQSMDVRTRNALEREWNRQWEIGFGTWSDRFETNLEQFLDNLIRSEGRIATG